MAEGGQDVSEEETPGSYWWDKWIKTAKEKSSTTLEFIKRDLTEFSQTVQQDTASAITSTASFLKDQLRVDEAAVTVASKAKEGFSTIWGTIADAFILPKEIEDTELCMIQNSEPVLLDRWQARLHAIQSDPKTYCHEPESPPEDYEAWLESFNLDARRNEVDKILNTNTEVQELYNRLVPSSVSHLEFWQRYFYRVHQVKKNFIAEANQMVSQQGNSQPGDATKNELSSGQQWNTTWELSKGDNTIVSNAEDSLPETERIRTTNKLESTQVCTGDESSQQHTRNRESVSGSFPRSKDCAVKAVDCDSTGNEELITKEKGDVVVVCPPGMTSSGLSPDSSKEESTEDDWEKDFDLDLTEEEKAKEMTQSKTSSGVTT